MSLFPTSLRSKITLGYYAVGALFLGLAVFAIGELRSIEQAVRDQKTIAQFFGTVQEVRNAEKNIVLYRKAADYRELTHHLETLRTLVDVHHQRFEQILPAAKVAELRAKLDAYGQQVDDYWQAARARPRDAKPLEEDVRVSRSKFLEEADELARTSERMLDSALQRHRRNLTGSLVAVTVLVILVAQLLSRRVSKLLREMETKMEAIAGGELQRLEIGYADREIASLTTAFNHVLEQLQARNRDVLRAEKLASLGTMLSGVAHELNNPLSNISTSTQILIEEFDQPDRSDPHKLLAAIDGETERARNIVRTLLDFARERAFLREAVPLRTLLDDTVRLFANQIPPGVTVRNTVSERIAIHADRSRMQQVFLNLVRNAVEAQPGGGEVLLAARWLREAHEVEIRIEDRGGGITPEQLPRIFDPFFTTKEAGRGIGLGLFVVHEIVSEHGGTIVADSTPGQGTAFTIRLPELVPEREKVQ